MTDTNKNKVSVLDKKYYWPNSDKVFGERHNQVVYIGESIRVLGEIIHDFAKILEQSTQQKDTNASK